MLGRLGLTTKLVLLVGIPTAVLSVVPPGRVLDSLRQSEALEEEMRDLEAVGALLALIADLQVERGLTASRSGTERDAPEIARRLAAQREVVDRHCADPASLADPSRNPSRPPFRGCERVVEIRTRADEQPLSATFAEYSWVIEEGIRRIAALGARSNAEGVATHAARLDRLLRLMELAGRVRGALAAAPERGRDLGLVRAWIREQEDLIDEIGRDPSPEEAALLADIADPAFLDARADFLARAEKNALRESLREALGYGGLIHAFRNYVLRGEPRHRGDILAADARLRELAEEYRRLGPTPAESEALATILATADEVLTRLPVVDERLAAGWSAERIDAAVRIAEEDALEALRTLGEPRPLDVESWFAIATRRIAAIRAATTHLRSQWQADLETALEAERRRGAGVFLLLAAALVAGFGAVGVLGVHLRSRVAALSSAAERIEGEGLEEPVGLAGDDELARLARALERMDHEVRDRATALTRANEELEERVAERTWGLEEERRRLREFLDGSSELIQSVDAEGTLVYVNRAWCETLGIPPEEAPGLSIWDVIHPSRRDHCRKIFEELRAGGGETPVENLAFEARNGDLVELRGRVVPVRDAETGAFRTRGYFTNVSAERRLRADLSSQERLLRDFAAVSRQMLWIYDVDSERFVFVSQACEDLTGLPPSRLLEDRRAWFSIVSKDDAEALRRVIREAREGRPGVLEHRIRHADGSSRWMRGTVTPLLLAAGDRTKLAGVVEDVTQRRELQERVAERSRELEKALERARIAERERLRLLADVSHEMRNPVAGIVGLSDLLAGRDLDPESSRYARLLHSASQGLLRLLEDLLDYSKLEAGGVTLRDEPVEIREMIEECFTLLELRASSSGVALAADVEDGFPERILADPTRLREVALNFLTNAVAHSGGGSVTVGVRRSGADSWTLEVRDTGKGIPDELRKRLFERFERGGEAVPGSGLGLAISRRIVVAMQGTLDVESRVGVGTTMTVRLPLRVPPDAEVSELGAPLDLERAGTGHRILAADDDLVIQLLVQTYLGSAGFEVDVVGDGRSAVERSARESYSAILLDTRMPILSGPEAAAAIRARDDRTPILFVTAATEAEMDACRDLEDGHVAKPFDRQALVESVVLAISARPRGKDAEVAAASLGDRSPGNGSPA